MREYTAAQQRVPTRIYSNPFESHDQYEFRVICPRAPEALSVYTYRDTASYYHIILLLLLCVHGMLLSLTL